MTKSDLRSGMIVELRNGTMGILIETEIGLIAQFADGWGSLKNLKHDLVCVPRTDKEYDIVKVRNPSHGGHVFRKHFSDAPIIWERKEDISTIEGFNDFLQESGLIYYVNNCGVILFESDTYKYDLEGVEKEFNVNLKILK